MNYIVVRGPEGWAKLTRNGAKVTEIGLLNYPGAQLAAVYGMTDLFRIASQHCQEHGVAGFRVTHWSTQEGRMVRGYSSDSSSEEFPRTVIVPGTVEGIPPFPGMEPCLDWLRECHSQGVTLASVCGGAFVLGEAGLLHGRRATTHWLFANQLRERFPAISVDTDQLLIEDGDIITAGGVMAWIDLCLRLIHRYAGPTVMLETSRFFLVDPPGREQRFYSAFAPNLTHGDDLILQAQRWLQVNYAQAQGVAELAEQALLSERSFLRRFQKATGQKPTEYLQNLRVAKAREALEFTKDTVNEIAWKVGYEDPGAFRKVFRRIIGLSPGDYRRRFSPGVLAVSV